MREMKCAYDIYGIHPDDLVGQPSFPIVHGQLWEIMREKNWVCWDADSDVRLLESLFIRYRLPLVPRDRVVCAMKQEFPNAHDAAADVKATISVTRWAYTQARTWASR